MGEGAHDLPEGTTAWLAGVAGGEITRLERHVARREAWVVDVTRTDGSILEGFVRLERTRPPGVSALEKETRIVAALGPTSVPVPRVHAWNRELGCTLFERARGRSDLDLLADPARQRAVMEDFIRAVARLHTLDPDELGLDDVMAYKPTTPAECALGEVDLVLDGMKDFLAHYSDPLISYSVEWLRRFVPKQVARVSLVQGDTGPVNFLFDGDRVSAIVDWELGHYGDPMEDLGNISVREFWNPCGGLSGLFKLYEEESGIPYDRTATQYYRVQQNVRGMIGIHLVTVRPQPGLGPLAWYLLYRYAGDRSTCEAMAEAMDIQIERPEMPDEAGEPDALAEEAALLQEHGVVPAITDPFAASQARQVKILVQCMDRRRRYGAAIAATELDELHQLLGTRSADLAEGLRALDRAIAGHTLDDERIIRYLSRRAYRDEWLFAPAMAQGSQGVGNFPPRQWAPID
jgi:aminoglycoside phosphotransferase (APT) family kinase protein